MEIVLYLGEEKVPWRPFSWWRMPCAWAKLCCSKCYAITHRSALYYIWAMLFLGDFTVLGISVVLSPTRKNPTQIENLMEKIPQ